MRYTKVFITQSTTDEYDKDYETNSTQLLHNSCREFQNILVPYVTVPGKWGEIHLFCCMCNTWCPCLIVRPLEQVHMTSASSTNCVSFVRSWISVAMAHLVFQLGLCTEASEEVDHSSLRAADLCWLKSSCSSHVSCTKHDTSDS